MIIIALVTVYATRDSAIVSQTSINPQIAEHINQPNVLQIVTNKEHAILESVSVTQDSLEKIVERRHNAH